MNLTEKTDNLITRETAGCPQASSQTAGKPAKAPAQAKSKSRRWLAATVIVTLAMLTIFAAVTVLIDPFFHYGAPKQNLAYPITTERYQNDGITKHFEYDGIITGSSMTRNAKTSEAEALFGGKFIKVPYSGGYSDEIGENLIKAFDTGKPIKTVIRTIDIPVLDELRSTKDTDLQLHLYDENPLNDCEYLLNKSILFEYTLPVLSKTRKGEPTESFDEYDNFGDPDAFGEDVVAASLPEVAKAEKPQPYTFESRDRILENVHKYVTDLADANPGTEFYVYYPPYSIYYWWIMDRTQDLDCRIAKEKTATIEMLEHPNIHLFGFADDFELTCNLDNYMDYMHYEPSVNSLLLKKMANDEHRLTKDNYLQYYYKVTEFYKNYDYEPLTEKALK